MKKIILILPILLSLILFSCRKPEPDPPEQHQLRQEIKDWGYFEMGSYWVFQNDSTLYIDTLRVTRVDTIETGSKLDSKLTGIKSDIYNGFRINLESSLSEYSIFLNFDCGSSYVEEITFAEQIFLRTSLYEINQFENKELVFSNSFMLLSWDEKKLNNKYLNKEDSSWTRHTRHNDAFSYIFNYDMQKLSGEVNVYDITEVLDSYTLNGKTYSNVYHIKAYSLTNPANYYPEFHISDFWIAKNVGIIKKVFRHYNGLVFSQSLIDHRVYQ